ncbi:MAG: type II toxin-antitoxin system PemK/MazF family toxin [Chloroflexi bacterium]|nr:type II toxin-antitoxin system PemK/MazF family toxin [Chloroflexota bacterium]
MWLVDLNPVCGHEQAGMRRALVVSTDLFNHGPTGLVMVVPLTTRQRGTPLHVGIAPPEGGIRETSYAKCEDVRSISTERLIQRWGMVHTATMTEVEDRLCALLKL